MSEEAKATTTKKKKKGGKLLMIVLPIVFLLIAGSTVVVLAFIGKIYIPGISKTKVKAPVVAAKPAVKVAAAKPKPLAAKPKPTPPKALFKVDAKVGRAKLAELWNEMEPDKLVKMTSTWKVDELAPILTEMDIEKVTAYLGALDEKRASLLSKRIQSVASVVPNETP